jgi:gag-polypeptide of LTR copia-type
MSGDTVNVGGNSFRIEPLKGAENWTPWKRRMTAIFRELDLDELIAETAKAPEAKNLNAPTEEEKKAKRAWEKRDEKARTRIELAVADSEFVHLFGAETAREQWKQLCQVYESKGLLAVLQARRALF